MNVLIASGDYSAQSDQPLMKSIKVHIAPAEQIAARPLADHAAGRGAAGQT